LPDFRCLHDKAARCRIAKIREKLRRLKGEPAGETASNQPPTSTNPQNTEHEFEIEDEFDWGARRIRDSPETSSRTPQNAER
jgi:hypothetical protein